jgi:2'-5' RNA ligase
MSDPRLFVALPVAEEVAAAVDAALAPMRTSEDRVAWTRSDGWHVTLAFLGTVQASRVDEVVEVAGAAVRSVAAAGALGDSCMVRLRVGVPGTFGDRVAWLRVDDEPTGVVAALGSAVKQALAVADLPVDRKPVRPHLTLARGRGRLPGGFVDRLPTVEAAWSVGRAVVVASILGKGPARYEEVASLPFAVTGST